MESSEVPCKDTMKSTSKTGQGPQKLLSEAARRALAEAEARRNEARDAPRQVEQGGRGGLDPARYGDWEVRGIACDF
jgi:hypothetical protein